MMEELKRRKSENLYKTYVPNQKCEEFIKLVGSNKSFVNLFCAANGVGKSAVGANIVCNICYPVENKWFDSPLYRNFPYLKRGRVISDPTTLKEKTVPELKKWFPSNRWEEKYTTKKESKNIECKWITDTGFEFDLMSTEQSPKEFESTDLGWVWIDEPCPKSIFLATVARLRRGGIIFWTMTPLTYSAWIKDEIYDKRDGVNQDYVTADVEDNCKEHGVRGILSHSDIERMAAQYPDDEKEARLHGKFGHLLGLVHKKFDTKIHVIDPIKSNPDEYTVYMALDTHPRVEDAAIWMAVDRKGQKYIIGEIKFETTDTDVEMAEKIKKREIGWNVADRLLDPSGFIEDQRGLEKSFADRLSDQGLLFRKGSKDLIGCIRKTNEALDYQMKGDQMVVKPEVFICSNCVNLIRELQNYVWDEYTGKGADQKDPKQSPKDINDHFVEDLHRLLIEDFKYQDPVLQKSHPAQIPGLDFSR